jgi:hypothetical protein
MKRWLVFSGTLLLLIGLGKPSFALQMGGYLNNRLQIMEGDTYDDTIIGANKLKLDFQVNADTYFMCGSLTGINNYGNNYDPDNSNSLEVTRAYLELYPAWGKVTAGLQNIAWGSGYLFNLADQFNQPNPLDPKGEKEGINALGVKWNFATTGFWEAVAVPGDTLDNSDFGIRSKYTLGRFDMIADHLKKGTVKTTVLELKGELGDGLPGVWGQYAATCDPGAVDKSFKYLYTFGCDYTFDIGNGLYLLAEYNRDFQTDGFDQLYSLIRYSPSTYLTINLSSLTDIQNKADLFSLNLRYLINDNIDFSTTYNYYPEGSSKLRMFNPLDTIDQELILELKTSF